MLSVIVECGAPGEADCQVNLSWGWIGAQGGQLGDLLESLVA